MCFAMRFGGLDFQTELKKTTTTTKKHMECQVKGYVLSHTGSIIYASKRGDVLKAPIIKCNYKTNEQQWQQQNGEEEGKKGKNIYGPQCKKIEASSLPSFLPIWSPAWGIHRQWGKTLGSAERWPRLDPHTVWAPGSLEAGVGEAL